MKIRAIIALVGLSAVVLGCQSQHTQHDATGSAYTDITEVLLSREAQWTESMRTHDYNALNDILAPEYRLTFVPLLGLPGKPEVTRETWLANLDSMTFGPVEMHDQTVTMHGPTVAVVTMHMRLHDWKWNGQTRPPNYNLTDVWVLRDQGWQVVNRISDPLDPPPGDE